MQFCWAVRKMAKVLLVLKVLPSSVEADLNQIKERIVKEIGNVSIKEEPIAFGLTALIVNTLIEDREGEVERIENKIKSIENVGEIEVIEVARTL